MDNFMTLKLILKLLTEDMDEFLEKKYYKNGFCKN